MILELLSRKYSQKGLDDLFEDDAKKRLLALYAKLAPDLIIIDDLDTKDVENLFKGNEEPLKDSDLEVKNLKETQVTFWKDLSPEGHFRLHASFMKQHWYGRIALSCALVIQKTWFTTSRYSDENIAYTEKALNMLEFIYNQRLITKSQEADVFNCIEKIRMNCKAHKAQERAAAYGISTAGGAFIGWALLGGLLVASNPIGWIVFGAALVSIGSACIVYAADKLLHKNKSIVHGVLTLLPLFNLLVFGIEALFNKFQSKKLVQSKKVTFSMPLSSSARVSDPHQSRVVVGSGLKPILLSIVLPVCKNEGPPFSRETEGQPLVSPPVSPLVSPSVSPPESPPPSPLAPFPQKDKDDDDDDYSSSSLLVLSDHSDGNESESDEDEDENNFKL